MEYNRGDVSSRLPSAFNRTKPGRRSFVYSEEIPFDEEVSATILHKSERPGRASNRPEGARAGSTVRRHFCVLHLRA